MKIIYYIYVMIILSTFGSCKEVTEPDSGPQSNPAANVVINELFRIDSAKYYSHWWIELYNPTSRDIDISNWRIKFINSGFTINLSAQNSITSLSSGSFILITSSKNIFDDYWNVAPLTTLLEFGQSFPPLKAAEEIQLVDNGNNIISLLRYGNYTISAGNPFPNNISFGFAGEWNSICRYADPKGAYDTGNSSNDFFEERNPIAGYYSQRMKK